MLTGEKLFLVLIKLNHTSCTGTTFALMALLFSTLGVALEQTSDLSSAFYLLQQFWLNCLLCCTLHRYGLFIFLLSFCSSTFLAAIKMYLYCWWFSNQVCTTNHEYSTRRLPLPFSLHGVRVVERRGNRHTMVECEHVGRRSTNNNIG